MNHALVVLVDADFAAANAAVAQYEKTCRIALASLGISEPLQVLGVDNDPTHAALLVPALTSEQSEAA